MKAEGLSRSARLLLALALLALLAACAKSTVVRTPASGTEANAIPAAITHTATRPEPAAAGPATESTAAASPAPTAAIEAKISRWL